MMDLRVVFDENNTRQRQQEKDIRKRERERGKQINQRLIVAYVNSVRRMTEK
jgi:hypothetical protein